MAANTAPTTSPVWPWIPGDGESGRFVEQRLGKTRRRIKLVDLASALMSLAVGALAYLLLLVLVDHWVIGLGFAGRLLALLIFTGAAVGYCAWRALPLAIHSIHPAYAARAIERSEPSLKNSLINLLTFRGDRAAAGDAVYLALEQRAAEDLSRVEIEAVVDRSPLIVTGYVLAGLMAACAAYTIFSPKNPFQTIARVASPWSNIPRPSRVQIEDVSPGNAQLYQGQSLTVTTRVRGCGEWQPVTLFYTTADGQTVDKPIVMSPTKSGLRRQCEVPSDGSGVQQDLTYRIEAGDAATGQYQVAVRPAPAIFVERVEYQYPAYTGRQPDVVERQGDIRALEGSRVKILARANQSIGSAYIELDPDGRSPKQREGEAETTTPLALPLDVDGCQARGGFTIELKADRRTPAHAAYQVRFVTQDGGANEQPVVHQIEVLRDLSPEVEILAPQRERITIPEDGRQTIQIRAVDPDYALSKVALRAVCAGSDLINAPLLDAPRGREGQVVLDFQFEPRQLGLAAGDTVAYWVVAEDNRTSAADGRPEPNSARTRNRYIEIAPSQQQGGQKPASKPADRDQPSKDQNQQPAKDGDSPRQDGAGDQQKPADQSGEKGQTAEGSPTEKPSQENQSPAEGQPQPSPDQPADGQQQQGDQANQAPGTDKPQGQDAANGKQPKDGQAGDSPAEGGQKQQGDQANQAPGTEKPQGQGAANGQQAKDGQAGNSPAEGGQQQQGDQGNQSPGSGKPQGQGAASGRQTKDGASGNSPAEGSQQQQGDQAGQAPADDKPQGRDAADGQPAKDGEPRESPPAEGGQVRPGDPRAADQLRRSNERQGEPLHDGEVVERINEFLQRQQSPESPQRTDSNAPSGDEAKPGASGESGAPKADDSGTAEAKPTPANEKQGSGLGDRGQATAQPKTPDKSGQSQSSQATAGEKTPSKSDGAASKGGEKPQSPDDRAPPPGSAASESGDKGDGDKGDGDKGDGNQREGPGAGQKGDKTGSGDQPASRSDGASKPTAQAERTDTAGQEQGSRGSQPNSADSTGAAEGDAQGAGSQKESRSQPEIGSAPPQPGKGSGQPAGGGLSGSGQGLAGQPAGEAPPASEPNLEYARKATDMALEYLKEHQERPDPGLLKELQWTEKDWKGFLERWERLKRSSKEKEAGAAARRELDESLRSLGLSPRGERLRRGVGRDDALRGLRDAGQRSRPPSAYEDQFNAYKKGAARSSQQP